MSRRVIVVLVVVLAAVVVAAGAIVLLRPRDEPLPPIATAAQGVWRESGPNARYRLTITRNASTDDGVWRYTVKYPRSFKVPFPARLVQNEIEVWGQNDEDVLWVVSYDDATDTLRVTRPRSGESYAFIRMTK